MGTTFLSQSCSGSRHRCEVTVGSFLLNCAEGGLGSGAGADAGTGQSLLGQSIKAAVRTIWKAACGQVQVLGSLSTEQVGGRRRWDSGAWPLCLSDGESSELLSI